MVARPLVLAALALAGCAGSSASRRPPLPPPAGDSRAGARDQRGAGPALASGPSRPARPELARAVAVASSLVGERDIVVDGRDYGDDCAALVRAALDRAGHSLPAGARDAASLYGLAYRRGLVRTGIRAQPGDLIFLADRPGGAPAHVGLVAKVEPDGTALV
ncbi:MAG TPA: NlpC/P60 family protein, partial [Anaeromyxobacteraceae bacterium]|nr:NlpC/P60 family protein [Anaeromyxobacteraceae bacterium]